MASVRIPARVLLVCRERDVDGPAVRATARLLAEHGCVLRIVALSLTGAARRDAVDGSWREHVPVAAADPRRARRKRRYLRVRRVVAGRPRAAAALKRLWRRYDAAQSARAAYRPAIEHVVRRAQAFRADVVHVHGAALAPLARRLQHTLDLPVVLGGAGHPPAAARRLIGVAAVPDADREAIASAYRSLTPGATVHDEAGAAWYDEFYADDPRGYVVGWRESVYRPVLELIAERARPEHTVIDIGCGTGQLAELLHERGLERYVGFDFSAEAIAIARRRLPGVDLRVADVYTTPILEAEDYDLVICTEVLEHLEDDLGVLRRIRPGTRVLATVPSFNSESHRRFFWDAAEARAHYDGVLAGLEVNAVEISATATLYLLDGTIAQEPARRR